MSSKKRRFLKTDRNITLHRLAMDLLQGIRSFRWVNGHFSSSFLVSRQYLEIDLTYRCNLACPNCNRSCSQVPRPIDIPVEQIAKLIAETSEQKYCWDRIRVLGGEPTLHPQFLEIVQLLRAFRKSTLPLLQIVVCTNGYGRKVQQMLNCLPNDVVIKNTNKSGTPRLFRPFNRAPCDRLLHRFQDYTTGCRILSECGMGLTPMGYYPCAIAGGIDSILQYQLGKDKLPDRRDTMKEILKIFCPLCGHFGFQWPTRKPRLSPFWKKAYADWYRLMPMGHQHDMHGLEWIPATEYLSYSAADKIP